MIRIMTWYKYLVLVWLAFGLPMIILAYGFSEGDLSFDLSREPLSEKLFTSVVWFFLASPLVLAPLGFRKHRK